MGRKKMSLRRASPSCALSLQMTCPPGGQSTGRMRLLPLCWKINEETKKELADWVNASPEELADVIAGM